MPLPTLRSGMSAAADDLGLGGMLDQQVKDETDEERKKRMRDMQQRNGLAGSPAVMALLGNGMGGVLGV